MGKRGVFRHIKNTFELKNSVNDDIIYLNSYNHITRDNNDEGF